jgi:hypothetical protein
MTKEIYLMRFPKSLSDIRLMLSGGLMFPLAWVTMACCPDGTLPPCTTGPTILVSETFDDDDLPYSRNFNPSAAGRTITATVTSDDVGSRLTAVITDFGTGNIVAIELLPTSNSTTVSFVSTNNGAHVLQVAEIGTMGRNYTVLITEQ